MNGSRSIVRSRARRRRASCLLVGTITSFRNRKSSEKDIYKINNDASDFDFLLS